MKKALLIILSALIVILLVIVSYNYFHIPNLKVKSGNTQLEVLKFEFGWDTFLNNYRKDYPHAPKLAENAKITAVAPGSVLKLNFSNKPEYYEVDLWDELSEDYHSKNNEIIVPKQKGIYVLSVIGHWKQGQVLYVFKIEVK